MAEGARLGLIWAEADGGVIGRDGVMPWHLPEDLAHFRAVTMGGAVVMGRKTWESLPERFRPLPGRRNIIVTRRRNWSIDAEIAHSVDEALDAAATAVPGDRTAESGSSDQSTTWVIGGAQIFAATIHRADVLEVTRIRASVDGDTIAPPVDDSWTLAAAEPPSGWHNSRVGLDYRFERYLRSV